jgi:hypothetical protein
MNGASHHDSWCRYWPLVLLVLVAVGCREGKTAHRMCPIHQTEIWDAATSYYLDRHLKTNDLIDPKQLTRYFAEGQVPRCTLGTSGYAPFRILEGPKCPNEPSYHAVVRVPPRITKLRASSQ